MGGLDSTSMSTYLDHAATTPIRPVARDAVLAQMRRWFGGDVDGWRHLGSADCSYDDGKVFARYTNR